MKVSAHQRLELDLPSDWSATGLQGFTVFAQDELHRASQSFEQPILAELAWQRLDPALREYIHARQRFELALSLQWNATFQTLRSSSQTRLTPFAEIDSSITIPLEPVLPPTSRGANRSRNAVKPTRANPRRPAKHNAKPTAIARANGAVVSNVNADATTTEKSVPAVQPRAGGDPLEEPDPARLLEANLEPLLRAERSRWQREKLELTQRLFHVEAEKEVLFGKWTKVKAYLEREKAEGTPAANQQGIADARERKRRASNRKGSPSLSPNQAANIERLSSALMAHLVRLEEYRIKVKDIPHLTGETGPWRAVITHLLERGAVQREGNGLFIALSLVERLRRNLPPPKPNLVSATREQAKRVGLK